MADSSLTWMSPSTPGASSTKAREVHYFRDVTFDDRPFRPASAGTGPWVVACPFERQADAAAIDVHAQHADLDDLPLLDDLAGVFDPSLESQLSNGDKAFHAGAQFGECTEFHDFVTRAVTIESTGRIVRCPLPRVR